MEDEDDKRERGELDWMRRLSCKTIEGVLTIFYGGRDMEARRDNVQFCLPIYMEVICIVVSRFLLAKVNFSFLIMQTN